MAMALIGNLAAQLLPHAIDWGVKKLSHSSIGRGVGHKVQQFAKVMNSAPVRGVMKVIS